MKKNSKLVRINFENNSYTVFKIVDIIKDEDSIKYRIVNINGSFGDFLRYHMFREITENEIKDFYLYEDAIEKFPYLFI